MIEGGEDLTRQFNRGIDYIQNSFNTSEGVINRNIPTLLYKGIVIDIDFTVLKPTTTASLVPPFSIYAKIIGLDEDSEDPDFDSSRIYYPPLSPMHNLCIPEIGEEILILKESPQANSKGYYIGRINDSSPLNISYARDFVGINDPETGNNFRYGFSFDVRELRARYAEEMPSSLYNNLSIPVTFGDVVQQGRSKTYMRHSFNKNNKKGVLEQGIQLDGQQSSTPETYNFSYEAPGRNTANSDVLSVIMENAETGEVVENAHVVNNSFYLPDNRVMKESFDPSIGITTTKTIHFVDSAIKRIGDYTLQSDVGGRDQNDLNGADRGMIVNIADEIYNISSKNMSGNLYRQVLGEKLVNQQRETYRLMKEILTSVNDLAQSTSTLLNAFLDHEHALPRIDLDLEKEVEFRDLYRTEPVMEQTPPQIITIPAIPSRPVIGDNPQVAQMNKAIETGDMSFMPDLNNDGLRDFQDFFLVADIATEAAVGMTTPIPASTITVEQPPTMVSPGHIELRTEKKTLNFEAIIGGAENPRFTAQIATASGEEGVPDPEIGVQTEKINTDLVDTVAKVAKQQATISRLSTKITDFLSKNQFVN